MRLETIRGASVPQPVVIPLSHVHNSLGLLVSLFSYLEGASWPMIICTNCATNTRDDRKYCPACGSLLKPPALLTCFRCGKGNPLESVFCNQCGETLTNSRPNSDGNQKIMSPTPSSSPIIRLPTRNLAQRRSSRLEILKKETASSNICPRCGQDNHVDSAFCGRCNKSLRPLHSKSNGEMASPNADREDASTPELICGVCGNQNSSDSVFCIKCGKCLVEDPPPSMGDRSDEIPLGEIPVEEAQATPQLPPAPDAATSPPAATRACARCGKRNPNEGVFCSRCGRRLANETSKPKLDSICARCGKHNPVFSVFCNRCGECLIDET